MPMIIGTIITLGASDTIKLNLEATPEKLNAGDFTHIFICFRTISAFFLSTHNVHSRSENKPEAHRPQYKFILRLVTTSSFPRNCGPKMLAQKLLFQV